VLLASGEVKHFDLDQIPTKTRPGKSGKYYPTFGEMTETPQGAGMLLSLGDDLPSGLKQTLERNATQGKDKLMDLLGIKPGTNLNLDIPSGPKGESYITYVFKEGDEVVYVGRASTKGTPNQALARRIQAGHEHYRPGLILKL
jgi:hypothetical protein